jgi:hypothetical protein
MSRAYPNPLARGTSGIVERARSIKGWTRELLALADDAVVSVNELSCALPDCPPKETVVLVMQGSSTRQVSIHKPLSDVSKDDLERAFSNR